MCQNTKENIPNKDELTDNWGKLHNKELHKLYISK